MDYQNKKRKLILAFSSWLLAGILWGCGPSNVENSSSGVIITPGPTTTSTPSAMLLTAGSSNLNTGQTTTITAHVVDNIGQPVANTTVTFSLDNGLKGSLNSATAITNASGNATVGFAAGTMSTTVTVTGAIGSVSSNVSISIGGGAGGTVAVAAAPSTIVSGGTSTITATVRNSLNALVANTLVTFSLNNNSANFSGSSTTTATTNASGVATVVLTGASPGTVSVTATSTTYGNGSASVTITNPLIDAITVSALSPAILTYGSTTISALLSGPSITPLLSGHTVNFGLSNPAVGDLSSTTAITNASGVAQVGFTAKNVATTVIVTASYTPLGLSNSTSVSITSPPPDNVVSSATPTNITVYGTATISAIVTANSTTVPDGTLVSFILNDSTFGSLSAVTASTVNGKATTTFTASNKAGTVTITAVAGSVSSNISLPIAAAETGSIQFVSAQPQLIGIKTGTNVPTSTVTFAVKDVNGNPVNGTSVTFTMNGPGGGEYIGSTIGSTTATGSTDANGDAWVVLHSGYVAGPVTIIASTTLLSGDTISTSATQVSIGGGFPSATHWNLATSQFNLAGLKTSGLIATISAYVGDRFGNYNILQGTPVSFYAEGGAIDTQGITDSTGKTTVNLRTQYPIPADVLRRTGEAWYLGVTVPVSHPTSTYNPRDGWVTVLATTQGEEAFLDENGDGIFSKLTGTSPCPPGGYTCECANSTGVYQESVLSGASCTSPYYRSEGFLDLSEPYYDKNDDGCRNDSVNKNCNGTEAISADPFEEFIDANHNGTFDPPNGRWDGPDCTTSGCQTSKMIWKDIRVVFTGDYYFWPMPDGSNCYSTSAQSSGVCTAMYASGSFADAPASITKGTAGYFTVIIGDVFLNSLPGGTVITATASEGTVTPTSVTLIDGLSSGPTWFSFVVDVPSNSTKSVTTVSVSVNGGPPATLTVTLNTPPPAAPTVSAPTTGGAGSKQITLSWGAVTGATTYNVYVRVNNTPVTKLLYDTQVSGIAATTYTYTAATSGETDYFVVTAVGPGGESVESNQVSAMAP